VGAKYIRAFVLASALGATAIAALAAGGDLDSKARAIDARLLKIDAHTDVLLPGASELNYAPGHTSRTDLDNLKSGGIGAIAMAIAVGPGPRTAEGTRAARAEADAKLAWIQTFLKDHSDRVALALSASDIKRIHAAGKIAVLESFLNARSIGTDISAIDLFYRDGVRLFGFTHAGNNDFADSSRPSGEPAVEHHGLSPLGKEAVAKLNKLGIIIDVSQLTPDGVLQTIALSKAPVIASHSDVRALVENTRNLSDEELDAIKRNGGVVHLTAFNPYLRPLSADFDTKAAALRQRYGLAPTSKHGPAGAEEGIDALPDDKRRVYIGEFRELMPKATLSDYVNQIDYVVKRIGVDHVGIGTDFNHGAGIIGFNDESEAPNLTRELLRRGYSQNDIRKIWGGNFLRVFAEVEATAKRLAAAGSPNNSARISILRRGGASAGECGSSNAVCAVRRARPSVAES
jgi:membrane dipeptidase